MYDNTSGTVTFQGVYNANLRFINKNNEVFTRPAGTLRALTLKVPGTVGCASTYV